MKLPKRNFDLPGFQIAPMIDMTFLLLIFFMLTTKISKEQIKMDIHLPIASNAVMPTELNDRDIISIDDKGKFFAGNRSMTDKELAAYLRRRFKDYPPLRLYVRADKTTPGRKVKQLMKMAAEAGAIEVIFGSYQTP